MTVWGCGPGIPCIFGSLKEGVGLEQVCGAGTFPISSCSALSIHTALCSVLGLLTHSIYHLVCPESVRMDLATPWDLAHPFGGSWFSSAQEHRLWHNSLLTSTLKAVAWFRGPRGN